MKPPQRYRYWIPRSARIMAANRLMRRLLPPMVQRFRHGRWVKAKWRNAVHRRIWYEAYREGVR